MCFNDDSSVYQYCPASVRPCGLALLAAAAAACPRLRSATLAEHCGPCNDTGYEFPDFPVDAYADASGKAFPVDSLTESLPRLSALTALALHDVHAELGPLLAALPAAKQLRQLSLVEAWHGGGGGGRAAPLHHALSALTNMHTLQVCTFLPKCFATPAWTLRSAGQCAVPGGCDAFWSGQAGTGTGCSHVLAAQTRETVKSWCLPY